MYQRSVARKSKHEPVAGLSAESMAAAGLSETSSRALWIPAIVAVAVACAALAVVTSGPDPIQLWGGAAAGHRGPMGPEFLWTFGILGAGALVGGLLSRSRIFSVMLFNALTAFVGGMGIAVVLMVRAYPSLESPSPVPVALEVLFHAINWGLPLAMLQIATALSGRLIRRLLPWSSMSRAEACL
jgi:hypothetical protein